MSKSKTKIVLKALKKFDTIWHPESTVVFKSQAEKKVIGRFENDEIVELDEATLELCEKWGFKYDSELYDKLFGENEVEEPISPLPVVNQSKTTENNDDATSSSSTPTNEPDSIEPKTPNNSTNSIISPPQSNVQSTYTTTINSDFFNDTLVKVNHILEVNLSKFTYTEQKLNEELEHTKTLLSEMTSKYESIKSKFDAMKQIFS